MTDDAPRCEHRDGCSEPAVHWESLGDDRRAGLCAKHAADRERKIEGLRFHVGMLRAEMRCSECGNLAPEGVLKHDCRNPAPQPYPDER